MAKQSQVEESEIEAVAREIFAATVIRELGRFTPEHIAEKAFETAEVFVEQRKKYRRQPSNNQKSLTGEPCNAQESTVRP